MCVTVCVDCAGPHMHQLYIGWLSANLVLPHLWPSYVPEGSELGDDMCSVYMDHVNWFWHVSCVHPPLGTVCTFGCEIQQQLAAKEEECRQKDESNKEKDEVIREKSATIQEQQAEIQWLLAVSQQVSWHTSLVYTPTLLPFMVSNHGLQSEQ